MPDYSDLINLVRGPLPEKPLPCIWDFFPCHAGAVGNVPNFLEYYFDVDEKLRLQQKLQQLLPQALILPGIFPDLGVIVEVSAFGGFRGADEGIGIDAAELYADYVLEKLGESSNAS